MYVVQVATLSYRALFSWLNPLGYFSSRIIRPVGLAITFGAISSQYGVRLGWILTGASILAGAHAVIFGMALAVGNERNYGTLDLWLSSPQSKLGALCTRALPHLADGFLGGMITYLACDGLFGVMPLSPYRFAIVLSVALLSVFGFGVLIGALEMVSKDIFLVPNVAYLCMTALSGALVSTANLPHWIRPASFVSPLHNIMIYAEMPQPDLRNLLSAASSEIAVGSCWFALGCLVMRWAIVRSRR